MWPFTITRNASFSKTIPTSKAQLLKWVHDPEFSVRLSPLFKSIVQDPKDPKWYTITEKLPLFGGLIESSTTFRACWNNTDEGRSVEIFAGVGTHMINDIVVKDSEENPEYSVFTETVLLQAPFLLMPFIMSTMSKAHLHILDTLVAKAQELQTTGVITLIGIFVLFKMRSQDPYGLFHLTLNRPPSQGLNLPPATEWLNMGYWKNADTFPEACRALALKVISAGNVKKGGRVLDVGHGTGESLLLLLSPAVPQPHHLVGITSLEVHHQRSIERVQKYQQSNGADTKVDLYSGDAVCQENAGSSHPLSTSSSERFDSVLALDCAYHFNTRRRFLKQVFDKLAPGGTIALADICFSHSALRTSWTRILTSFMKLMPTHNLISTADYVAQMQQLGYVDVSLEDITDDVFPGFVKFLKSRRWGWWVLGCIIEWYASVGARFVIISGKKES